jgi:hypothetical protein
MGEKGLFTLDANLAGAFSRKSALLRNDQDTPTFLPVLHPPRDLVLPHPYGIDTAQNKIRPPILNNPRALFWVLSLIRAPLPSRISQTIGTLLYSCIRRAFHSWGLKSSFICGRWWSSAQWSCVWLRIIYRLFGLPFWRDWWYSSAIGCLPWCWYDTTLRPLL